MTDQRREGRATFVHLGERLHVIGRIRAGELSPDDAAAELGVSAADIAAWQRLHRADRIIGIDELRAGSPEQLRLMRRVEMLASLVTDCERQLRGLHQELIEASKQFGENHTPRGDDVAHPQPRAA